MWRGWESCFQTAARGGAAAAAATAVAGPGGASGDGAVDGQAGCNENSGSFLAVRDVNWRRGGGAEGAWRGRAAPSDPRSAAGAARALRRVRWTTPTLLVQEGRGGAGRGFSTRGRRSWAAAPSRRCLFLAGRCSRPHVGWRRRRWPHVASAWHRAVTSKRLRRNHGSITITPSDEPGRAETWRDIRDMTGRDRSQTSVTGPGVRGRPEPGQRHRNAVPMAVSMLTACDWARDFSICTDGGTYEEYWDREDVYNGRVFCRCSLPLLGIYR